MQRVIAENLAAFGYHPTPSVDTDIADPIAAFRDTGGEILVLVAGAEEGVVGTVAVLKDSDTTCILRRMYLDETYRGQGLGRELLEAAMSWARQAGFSRMELETAPTMTVARALYERAGFALLGESKRFGHCGVSYARDL
jgi:putative acetyltransferase